MQQAGEKLCYEEVARSKSKKPVRNPKLKVVQQILEPMHKANELDGFNTYLLGVGESLNVVFDD